MTSQTGKQIITTHILPNISRSKDNQTMKFGPLIEYSMRNIFLETPCTNVIFTLYSINLPNIIFGLPLLFEMLDNICIAIVCFLGCDVINFEINFRYLIKSFSNMTRKARTKI